MGFFVEKRDQSGIQNINAMLFHCFKVDCLLLMLCIFSTKLVSILTRNEYID